MHITFYKQQKLHSHRWHLVFFFFPSSVMIFPSLGIHSYGYYSAKKNVQFQIQHCIVIMSFLPAHLFSLQNFLLSCFLPTFFLLFCAQLEYQLHPYISYHLLLGWICYCILELLIDIIHHFPSDVLLSPCSSVMVNLQPCDEMTISQYLC